MFTELEPTIFGWCRSQTLEWIEPRIDAGFWAGYGSSPILMKNKNIWFIDVHFWLVNPEQYDFRDFLSLTVWIIQFRMASVFRCPNVFFANFWEFAKTLAFSSYSRYSTEALPESPRQSWAKLYVHCTLSQTSLGQAENCPKPHWVKLQSAILVSTESSWELSQTSLSQVGVVRTTFTVLYKKLAL